MIYNEEILDLFIQSIGQQIESLGDTYQDKVYNGLGFSDH